MPEHDAAPGEAGDRQHHPGAGIDGDETGCLVCQVGLLHPVRTACLPPGQLAQRRSQESTGLGYRGQVGRRDEIGSEDLTQGTPIKRRSQLQLAGPHGKTAILTQVRMSKDKFVPAFLEGPNVDH